MGFPPCVKGMQWLHLLIVCDVMSALVAICFGDNACFADYMVFRTGGDGYSNSQTLSGCRVCSLIVRP